jgi:hypothetical protein
VTLTPLQLGGASHAPTQHRPDAQTVPFATSLQAVVLVAGWQLSQLSAGFVVPDV